MKAKTAGVIGILIGVVVTLGVLYLRPLRYREWSVQRITGIGPYARHQMTEYRRDWLTGRKYYRDGDAHPRRAWQPLDPE
jgi:hypothetical protein